MTVNHSNKSAYKKRKKKSPVGLIIILLLVLLIGVAALIGYSVVQNEINGERRQSTSNIVVTVAEGSGLNSVSASLKEQGVISFDQVFRFYCKRNAPNINIQFGDHTFASNMTYDEIITELERPTILLKQGVDITFPEGTTALKMAMMLEEVGLCTVEDFISSCNSDAFDVPFYSLIPNNPNVFIKLEGYLFPDTYEITPGMTAHDIIAMMLDTFNEKVWKTGLEQDLASSDLTLQEIISLAAIIQKESFNGEEYNVSSVFHNRLQPGSGLAALQSDTTDNYLEFVLQYYFKGNAPKAMMDAYDSEVYVGIVEGAICNPGVNCIDAAVHPSDTPYYYFLTDNNKEFYYAVTYAEHVANWQIAKKVNADLAAAESGS